jgi:hypothetical protein
MLGIFMGHYSAWGGLAFIPHRLSLTALLQPATRPYSAFDSNTILPQLTLIQPSQDGFAPSEVTPSEVTLSQVPLPR